mmetsp:Transcript_21584/g.59898  ORF Transcript_21584/g.59898 Transcript_21584/m.59898 type:complete len:201 (+) Transcript_21584:1590-2192(+)
MVRLQLHLNGRLARFSSKRMTNNSRKAKRKEMGTVVIEEATRTRKARLQSKAVSRAAEVSALKTEMATGGSKTAEKSKKSKSSGERNLETATIVAGKIQNLAIINNLIRKTAPLRSLKEILRQSQPTKAKNPRMGNSPPSLPSLQSDRRRIIDDLTTKYSVGKTTTAKAVPTFRRRTDRRRKGKVAARVAGQIQKRKKTS